MVGIDRAAGSQRRRQIKKTSSDELVFLNEGGRTYKIRTCDQRIKSPLLYQLS